MVAFLVAVTFSEQKGWTPVVEYMTEENPGLPGFAAGAVQRAHARPPKLEVEEETASPPKLGGSILHQASPGKRRRTPLKVPLHSVGEAHGALDAGTSAAAGATAADMTCSAPPAKQGDLAAKVRDIATGDATPAPSPWERPMSLAARAWPRLCVA